MLPKTIKIFLASSAELKEDREEFRTFISVENDRLYKQGVYLEIVQWEYFLDTISDTRLQSEYNTAIKECDIALCLFFTKVGKYTAEEFDTAYQVFKDTGKPKIWTYFKDAPINAGSITNDILTMISFKEKLSQLGHFYSVYTNIDNLKYQFRNQLDKVMPQLKEFNEAILQKTGETGATVDLSETAKLVFNEMLSRKLIEAIQEYNPRAKKFLDNANRISINWEKQSRFSDPAKEIIAFSFVGILGIQLRKLMAIGKEETSGAKLRKYLENCQQTCKRSLQLLCFALISKLWDHKKEKSYTLSADQAENCKNFFNDEFELEITGYVQLLISLMSVFTENDLEYPISELKECESHLQPGSDFLKACNKLQEITSLLDGASYAVPDCMEAEKNLVTVLETLNFLANYKMVSIKSIDYYEMRNSKPYYLYNITALGVDIKSNVNQERISYADVPINTDAVLLYKGNYQQNLNLFPFIIDVNALAFEGGAKICFYACHNNTDGSLNYHFLEDNSIVNIANTQTLKSGVDINDILMDSKKRKDIMFDSVCTLFREAQKAITGIEENELTGFM